jgi:hypothetical protein
MIPVSLHIRIDAHLPHVGVPFLLQERDIDVGVDEDQQRLALRPAVPRDRVGDLQAATVVIPVRRVEESNCGAVEHAADDLDQALVGKGLQNAAQLAHVLGALGIERRLVDRVVGRRAVGEIGLDGAPAAVVPVGQIRRERGQRRRPALVVRDRRAVDIDLRVRRGRVVVPARSSFRDRRIREVLTLTGADLIDHVHRCP